MVYEAKSTLREEYHLESAPLNYGSKSAEIRGNTNIGRNYLGDLEKQFIADSYVATRSSNDNEYFVFKSEGGSYAAMESAPTLQSAGSSIWLRN